MYFTTQNKKNLIGILSALSEEADLILAAMTDKKTIKIGVREFVLGYFEKTPVVFSLSGIGKVSTAVTVTLLISTFNVSEVIFTGVAGGGNHTKVGDVVIGHTYLQHDLDLRPIAPLFYIYSLGKQTLEANKDLVFKMKSSATQFLSKGFTFPELGIFQPKVHEGTIVSGDQFINSLADYQSILEKTKEIIPDGFYAIEMEGAAVAQVCTELDIPFVVIRTISDKADKNACVDFSTFIDQVARFYSIGILKEYFQEQELRLSSSIP